MSVDLVDLVNQLRSTLGTMEVALGVIADAIVWTGSDGKVQWCNAAFDRLVKRSHILVLGSKLSEVLPLTQAGQAIALQNYPDARVLRGEYVVTEYAFEMGERSLILEISGSYAALGNHNTGEELGNGCVAVLVMRDVTQVKQNAVEQKQAEEALRQSELRFQAIFENVTIGTSLCASDGNILQVNPAWMQALGYSEAEFRQMKFADYTHPEDVAVDATLTQELFAGLRDSFQLEKRYIRKDNSVFWGRVTVSPIRDAEGNTQLTLALIEDINDRKQADEALQQSESRYRALVTATAQSVFTTNAVGEVVDDIPLWCALTGQSEVEAKGFGWLERVHPDDRDRTLQVWLEALRTRTLYEVEQRVQVASGEYRLFLVRAVPVFDDQGNIQEWVGTQTDITEAKRDEVVRKQAEIALTESEAKFRQIVENANDIISVIDLEGRISYISPNLATITGYATHELEGGLFMPFLHPDDQPGCLGAFQKVLTTGEKQAGVEYRARLRDGSWQWQATNLSTLHDADGNLQVISVARDITDRKQAEEALRLSELKYRNIFENSQIGIGRSRLKDGLFLDVNQRYAEIMGFSSVTDLIGKRFTTEFYASPDDRNLILTQLEQQGEVRNFEEQLRRADGTIVWGLLSLRLNVEENCLDFVLADISDRKRAEAALRQHEEQLRLALEASQSGIWDWNISDNQITWSERIYELHGVTPETFRVELETINALIHPEDQARLFETSQRAIAEKIPYQGEYRSVHPDGEVRWLLTNGQVLYDAAGQPTRMVGATMDLTDRKQAEAALHQREQEFRTLVENVPATIIRFDRHSRYLFINSQVERETGVPPAAFLGRTVAEMGFPEAVAIHWQGILDHVFETAQDYEAELELPLFGRLTYQSFRVVPELSRDGTVASVLAVVRDITESKQREAERKRLEAELLRSQQFLDSVIENIPLPLFVKDVTQDFCYALLNSAAEHFLGFSREDAIGWNDSTLITSEQADFYQEQDAAVISQGSLLEIPEQVKIIRGEERLARVLKVPIFDTQGQITHLLCISEDITERKQREEALRLIVEGTAATTSEQFFRSFVEYLARVMQVQYALVTEFADAAKTSIRTLAVWSRDTIAENFEYSLSGTPCNLVLTNDLNDTVCYYSEQVQAHFPDDLNLVAMAAESYLGIPLMDSSGQVLGHVAVLDAKPMPHDPGKELILKIFAARAGAELERKQVDEALQRRAEADGLLSQISRQFIDQDADTATDFTLQAIAHALGTERSCIFGLVYQPQSYGYLIHEWHLDGIEFIPDQSKAGYLDDFPMFRRLLDGNAFQIDCVAALPTDAPERAIFESTGTQSVVVVPMIHSSKVVGYITADVVHSAKTWSQEDINLMSRIGELIAIAQARYQAEEALRVAKDEAEAANRAKSTFLANMSHELRTPLNAILGFAQLMQRDPVLTPRQQGSLATINRSGEHLLNLINEVLEMSKIEAGRTVLNPASFDLHRLLQTLQEMFQERASVKRLSLQFEMADNLPQYIFTDEGKLRQVLINLLSNAVKFTEVGGVILRASRSIAHAPPNDEMTLRFEVEDTGVGIAADEVKELFQPFVQTVSSGRSHEGTGLGLAISRQFVHLMNGEIALRSLVGQGSLFSFTIKASLATPVEVAAPHDDRQVSTLAPNQPTYRILVADDRPENLDLMIQLLDQVGFETRTATDGQGAIAQWQTWQPHLIWMDMRMPGMDGYEATRQIRAIEGMAAHTVIIALTASAFDEQKATIFTAGCDDVVSKPFKAHVIFDKLAEHLGVQYLYEPEIESPLPPVSLLARVEDLNAASLQIMSSTWLAELQQAALTADGDRILQLIEQIPPNDSEIAQQLTELVQQFDFDEILALTEAENQ